ncbi:hypothetical protein Tco_0863871 [Tanacetum coccineum]
MNKSSLFAASITTATIVTGSSTSASKTSLILDDGEIEQTKSIIGEEKLVFLCIGNTCDSTSIQKSRSNKSLTIDEEDKNTKRYVGIHPIISGLADDRRITILWRRGKTKDYAIEIHDACGFHPRIGITVLIQKALITISNGKFDMHDLVKQMGQYIIRGNILTILKNIVGFGFSEDIEDLCSRDGYMETDNVKAIECFDHDCSSRFYKLVLNMKKLRLLSVRITDNEDIEEPTFLSNELRDDHSNDVPSETPKPHRGKRARKAKSYGSDSTVTSTRHDIAYAVGRLSRFTSNPSRQHWHAITRVFKYLKGTMNYGLSYVGYPSVLEAYSDASWINHVEDSSSTSG